MGDVADIMGVVKVPQKTVAETAVSILAGIPKDANRPKKIKKPKGMSREVFDLMGPGGLTSSIETNKLSTGFKDKRVSATKGKWIWAPFKNSARGDDMLSHHWAKADVQYAAKLEAHMAQRNSQTCSGLQENVSEVKGAVHDLFVTAMTPLAHNPAQRGQHVCDHGGLP